MSFMSSNKLYSFVQFAEIGSTQSCKFAKNFLQQASKKEINNIFTISLMF